ncbi:pseudouridine synthase [Athalassotoga saccharophila]|uniref:pseudouridine synthase n=1 Tax=Athalassotoga saccharophila TaxID=1441386 RepID=UPI00137B3602|nr:pseudouridine synthase [Athalassotoga saccharophila]BBJ27318.1 ribosomal large subunit pseudouridine synthase B [Athalassotoga saccharophila]
MRIQKYLRMCGITSRRKAEELVINGKVSVNGNTIHDFVSVNETDDVRVEGKSVKIREKVYYIFNKPAGYLTTKNDPQGRKTIFDILKIEPDIFPVGRLDADTEGLLILTNDGDMAQKLLHPRFEVPRNYELIVESKVEDEELKKLEEGITLPYGYKARMKAKILRYDGSKTYLRVSISEGRKREIRRTFKFIGHPVIYLKRVSFGPFNIGDLPRGSFRKLTEKELRELREYVNRK